MNRRFLIHDVPHRHTLLRAGLTMIGILFLFSPCIWCVSVFELPADPVERRGPPGDVEQSVRWVIDNILAKPRLTPLNARAESVSDGFHGEGYDWYVFELSTAQMADFARSEQRSTTTAPTTRATLTQLPGEGHPPTWWDIENATDLARIPTEHATWWIGISASRRTVYVRSARL